MKLIKPALEVTLQEQTVAKPVLQTVLVEVEGIMNTQTLGYLYSDAADPDPVTPGILLMGRHDASSELLGKHRWRHSKGLADHFWSSFICHYLPSLQERQKWRRERWIRWFS